MPSRAALEDLDVEAFDLGEARLFATRLKAGDDPRDLLPLMSPAFRMWLFPGAPDSVEALAARLTERWEVLGIEELLQPPRRAEYLIDGLLRKPSLSCWYGPPGDLKSMLLMDLAVCAASGQDWLAPLPNVSQGGGFHVQQGPVLWLDMDNGPDRLKERFGALCRARGITNAPIYAISLPRPVFDASKPEEADLLAAQVKRLGAVLLVVDNLGTVSGGRDRFHCTATWWFCRQCHQKRGDVIEYVRWHHGVGFREACARLDGGKTAPSARFPERRAATPAPEHLFPETEPPSAVWQARAQQFVAYAQGQPWQDEEALAYLRDRGLSDDTVRAAGLGYYDGPERDKNVRHWDVQGTYVWLPRGWVIPCESGGVLWYVKVRRHADDLGPDPGTASGRVAKYQTLKGGRLTMYGLETLRQTHFTDCIICEGEFDALLVGQHVGSLVGCVALGSATKGLDMQAVDQLVAIRRVWLALDTDKAGEAGAKKLLAASARIHPLPVPAHDVTDAWRAGRDLVD